MGNKSSTNISITSYNFDIRFTNNDSNSMVIRIIVNTTNGIYEHLIYEGEETEIVIVTLFNNRKYIKYNKCNVLEKSFRDLQKLADETKIYDNTLINSSRTFSWLKNNIINTSESFKQLPIYFLGNYLNETLI